MSEDPPPVVRNAAGRLGKRAQRIRTVGAQAHGKAGIRPYVVPERIAHEKRRRLLVVERCRNRKAIRLWRHRMPARVPAATSKTLKQLVDTIDDAAYAALDDKDIPVDSNPETVIALAVPTANRHAPCRSLRRLPTHDHKRDASHGPDMVAEIFRRILLRRRGPLWQHDHAFRGPPPFGNHERLARPGWFGQQSDGQSKQNRSDEMDRFHFKPARQTRRNPHVPSELPGLNSIRAADLHEDAAT